MLNRTEERRMFLEDAIFGWSKEHTVLIYECACKLQKGVWTDPELYYTPHNNSFSIENSAKILNIKVKDRSLMESGIDITTGFHFKGFEYILKSAMLYTGDGLSGHWRSLINKKDNSLVIFDDAKEPYSGTLKDFEVGTDFIFGRKFYHCPFCEKSFVRLRYRRHHMLNEHNGIACDDCEDMLLNEQTSNRQVVLT